MEWVIRCYKVQICKQQTTIQSAISLNFQHCKSYRILFFNHQVVQRANFILQLCFYYVHQEVYKSTGVQDMQLAPVTILMFHFFFLFFQKTCETVPLATTNEFHRRKSTTVNYEHVQDNQIASVTIVRRHNSMTSLLKHSVAQPTECRFLTNKLIPQNTFIFNLG